MARQSLQYLATQWSYAQQNFIDDLVKDSGILRTALVGYANNGMFHKYNKATNLPTASIRNINGSVVPYTTTYDLLQLDLKEIMTVEQVDSTLAKADPGGAAAYFNKVKAGHMESLAQSAEKSIIYGTSTTYGAVDGFKGFHNAAYAAEQSRSDYDLIDAGGTTNTTSIFAVHWKPEVCQLVIPSGAAAGDNFVLMTVLNNGEPRLVVTDTTTGAMMPAYEVMYQIMMGFQAGSIYSVSRIVGVDGNNAPTAEEIDKLVDVVKGDSANTVIYTSRMGKRAMQTLKSTKFFTQAASDQGMNTLIDYWNGIPVVVSENILETETKATIDTLD